MYRSKTTDKIDEKYEKGYKSFMNELVFEIYKYAQIIPAVKDVISYAYSKEINTLKTSWKDISLLIPEFCNVLAKENLSLAGSIMDKISSACNETTGEVANYNRMGDLLSEVIPLLEEGMACISNIDVSEGDYTIASSKSGFLTLKNNVTNRFYHGLNDPLSEATEFAKRLYKPNYTKFHIAGCSLGYLPLALYYLSDMSVELYIYHTSETLVSYAWEYGVLSWIPEENLHVIVDSEKNIINKLEQLPWDDGKAGFTALDDFMDIVSDRAKEDALRCGVSTNTNADFGKMLDINLWQNVANISNTIYDIKDKFKSAEWFVVVAGPSLDEMIEYLKSQAGNVKIICASTVYKKLLSNGITPDFVCVCDPQPRTFNHFEGVEKCDSVLLLETCSNWRFSKYYAGPKYLVPSSSSVASMNYYKARGCEPFFITGSVSYMCVLMAHFLGAKTIHLIGMDLAYPNGLSHASGTMDVHEVSQDGMLEVPCVAGGTVLTSKQFKYYIDTMNELFTSLKGVKIINHSDIGAAFNNTEWYKISK